MGLKEWLIPQDSMFFDLLEEESANVVKGAHKLEEMINEFDRLDERRSEIKQVEHHGDEIVHAIYEKVNATFVTPIDHDDITKLASLYDDVLDFIYAVANRVFLYELLKPTESMKQLAVLVTKSVDEIHLAFGAMKREDRKQIDARCIEIDRLENEADTLLNEAVAKLLKTDDVISIIKLKEIYEHLETATDMCEDVSQELRDIVRRYA